MRARDVVEAAMRFLSKELGALLCSEPDCVVCPQSRRMIAGV
jgi:hypothetical protein